MRKVGKVYHRKLERRFEPFVARFAKKLFDISDKDVKAQGLSYTECNFEKLNGKTVNKTAAAL